MSFSVVIPLYNKSYSIARCIDSVLTQNRLPLEIIIVNDGSTDDSMSIVDKKYANEIKKGFIRVVEQSNKGVSISRNVGVEVARSEYICFLDADDEWLPGFLEEMSLLIKDFSEGHLYCLQHETKLGSDMPVTKFGYFKEGFKGYIPNYFKAAIYSSIANSSKICVRKESLGFIGGFPENEISGEDLYVWMELAFEGKVVFFNKVLSRINISEDTSRVGRSESVPYPFKHYSKLNARKLTFWAKIYLLKVYFSHLIASLKNKDIRSAFKRTEAASKIFPMLIPVSYFLKIVLIFKKYF